MGETDFPETIEDFLFSSFTVIKVTYFSTDQNETGKGSVLVAGTGIGIEKGIGRETVTETKREIENVIERRAKRSIETEIEKRIGRRIERKRKNAKK